MNAIIFILSSLSSSKLTNSVRLGRKIGTLCINRAKYASVHVVSFNLGTVCKQDRFAYLIGERGEHV